MKPAVTNDSVTVRLTRDEVRLLHQALNEVCNGVLIDESEFSTRLGVDRAEAILVMQVLGHVYDLFGRQDNETR